MPRVNNKGRLSPHMGSNSIVHHNRPNNHNPSHPKCNNRNSSSSSNNSSSNNNNNSYSHRCHNISSSTRIPSIRSSKYT